MAKKKVRYPKKKMQTIITSVIIGVLLVVFVGGLSVESYARSYIMRFDGRRITSNEHSFYAANFGDNALDVHIDRLVVEKMAQEFNLEIDEDDEDNEELFAARDSYLDAINSGMSYFGLSAKDIIRIFNREIYADMLFERMTADVEIDDEAFAEHLEEERHNQRLFLSEVNVDYIITETEEEAAEVKALAESGTDFKELILEHCIEYFPPEPIPDYDEFDDYYPVDIIDMDAPEGLFGNVEDDAGFELNNDVDGIEIDFDDEDFLDIQPVDDEEFDIDEPEIIDPRMTSASALRPCRTRDSAIRNCASRFSGAVRSTLMSDRSTSSKCPS